MSQLQTILRRHDVERATGLKRSTIYDMMADGRFPKPIPLGAGRKGGVGWLESEIASWQAERIAERDAAGTKAA
jgi:prophage regulatory protein